MPQPNNKFDAALRVTRIIATLMLAYVPVVAIVLERLQLSHGIIDRTFFTAICVISLVVILVGIYLRKRLVERNAEALRLNSEDATAISKWRAGQIVSFALAESIALYGVVLRTMGATLIESGIFYSTAIVMFILWWPQAP